MISPHLRLPCLPPIIPSKQLHTALCNYIYTAAQISGSVSQGFYHSASLSHSRKYFAAYKRRTWLLIPALPYTVNTFNQPFPALYAVWLVLATADRNNHRPVHNKQVHCFCFWLYTHQKRRCRQWHCNSDFDSAKTVADLRTKFMPFDADFPIPFHFRATSKELGLHPPQTQDD